MSQISTIRSVSVFIGVFVLIYILVYVYRSVEYSRNAAVEESLSGAALMRDLGKLMVLPSAQPTIATVVNADLLHKRSSFFKTAKDGDTLFLYPDKVIIFDTHTRKIVNVGLSNKANNAASDSAKQ
jgi:hypothetical protein